MPIFDGLDSPSPEAGVSPDKGSVDYASLREKIFGVKSKSTKRKTPTEKEKPAVTEKELDEIFAGENWEEISGLYFQARFAITGFDGFLLTPNQKKVLGLSLSSTMKMLLKIDPGYIALVVFVTNFGGLIAQKELTYKSMVAADNERKRKTS